MRTVEKTQIKGSVERCGYGTSAMSEHNIRLDAEENGVHGKLHFLVYLLQPDIMKNEIVPTVICLHGCIDKDFERRMG